ncbi:MAG: outer membrane protein assembly factor BamC [Pseudomonadota bacterium]
MRKMLSMKMLSMLLAPALAGCGMFSDDGTFRDRSRDYLSAREYPVIRVPEGLDDEALGQLYAIPQVSAPLLAGEERTLPRPQPLGTSLLEEDIRVQSLGDRRWVWINRSPAEVWPRVRNLLNTNNIVTDRSDAAAGVIETAWVEFDDDPGNQHRYRLRIEEGMQPDTSEIAVQHLVAPRGGRAPSWDEAAAGDRRTLDMIDFVASGLAGGDTLGSVSLLAQSIGGGAKVEMVAAGDAPPYLLIKMGYDRSWASVAYSVSREDFQLVDQDRGRGLFFVNLKTELEEDRPGFFARMLGAESGAGEQPVAARYRIELKETQDGVLVRVESEEAELERARQLELLQRIRANLA